MVLVVVGHLQKRSALQAKKPTTLSWGKPQPGFWLLFCGHWSWLAAVSGIDRQVPSVILTPSAQPELLVGDPAFELLGHLGANLLEHGLLEPGAEPEAVAAGISRRRALSGRMHLPPSAHSLQSVPTGALRPGPEKAQR